MNTSIPILESIQRGSPYPLNRQTLSTESEFCPTLSAFSDPDAHAHALSDWEQSFIQLLPGKFSGTVLEVDLNDIKLVRETTSGVLHERGFNRGSSLTICVPIQMKGIAYFNGLPWTINACTSLLGSSEFDLVTGESLDLVSITAESDRLRHVVNLGEAPAFKAGSSVTRISASQLPRLTITLGSILRMMTTEPELLKSDAVRRDIEDSICEVLADALSGAIDTRNPRAIYSVRRRIVLDAIEYVKSDPYGNVNVSELCRLLNVNRRTLQEYFQEVVASSPKQYLLAYRLGKVRSLIVDSDGSIPIKDAAMRWGFWHLSDFTRMYKRHFQELPSSTVKSRRCSPS